MMTPEFTRFVEPATRRPQFWRIVVGFILIVGFYLLGIAVVFGSIWMMRDQAAALDFARQVASSSGIAGVLLLLLSFTGGFLGPMIVVRVLHKRPAATLVGPRAKALRHFGMAAATVGVVNIIGLSIWALFYDATPSLSLVDWAPLLPLIICGLLIQTGAEELVFRGYLMQQLAARFQSPIIWMLLPSVAFGLMHYEPGSQGTNVWWVVGATAVFALVAADLTRITGSLGAAWGLHFANNFFAIAIISVQGSINGISLYLTPYTADDAATLPTLIVIDTGTLLLVWFLLRRLLQR